MKKYSIIVMFFFAYPLLTMESKNKQLSDACKHEAFGTTRQTRFDKKTEKKIKSLQKDNPEKYNRIVAAANQKHTNNKNLIVYANRK